MTLQRTHQWFWSKKIIKLMMISIFLLTGIWMTSQTSFANSAEPPGFILTVSHAPQTLKVGFEFENADGLMQYEILEPSQKAWETQYIFYYGTSDYRVTTSDDLNLLLSHDGQIERYFLSDLPMEHYHNYLILDFRTKEISVGRPLSRAIISIGLRLGLTLVIEGLILLAFGYRSKRTWLIFIIVNLITQAGLNIMVEGPFTASYWIIGYLAAELIIMILETTVYGRTFKEHTKSRAALYGISANFISLILGAYLISILPF